MYRLLLNLLFFVLLFSAEWRLARMLLAWAQPRWSHSRARLLRGVLWAAFAALLAGFALGFVEIRTYLPITSPLAGEFSGLVQLWLLTSSAAYGLYLLAKLLLRSRVARGFDASRRNVIHAAGGALIASPFLVIGYGAFVERTAFRVREVDVPIPNLPPDLEGLRLLQLSDIHLSPFLSESELERVIAASNETRAHIALVTGDLISSRGDPLDACLRQVSRLKADAGILGCLGNHERYTGAESYAAQQGARLGVHFLRGANRQFRFGSSLLNFAGVDYQPISVSRSRYLRGAERMVVPQAVNVLLSHNPDVFPVAAQKGYDLTIAGHTHGGQVTVEILSRSLNPARFFTPYVYGLYRLGRGGPRPAAYVSRGIGTIGIPARVGAPPEISLLRLRKA